MAQSATDTSLVSEASSTAGDVLIRSTSIERSRVSGQPPGTSHRRSQQESPGAACIPPALSANRAPGRRALPVAPHAVMICEQPPQPKQTDRHMLMDPAHLKMESKNLAELSAPKNDAVYNEHISKPKENLYISQYKTGQKEAMRACLKQRIHETSGSKEVRVQLLQDIAAEKSDDRANDKSQEPSKLDSAGIIAAATAAAIATAAPLLKAQSDLDAKIGSVSELINKLQADQQQRHSTEQLAKVQTHPENERWYQEKVEKLECKLEKLTEQRMRHMESLQQQQFDLQSRFLSSAINTGGLQGVRTNGTCAIPPSDAAAKPMQQQVPEQTYRDAFPVTKPTTHVSSSRIVNSDQSVRKSPLETPAPRRFAPVPMSKDVGVLLKDKHLQLKGNVDESKFTANLEKGRFLEQILRHSESPASHSTQLDKTPVTRTKLSTYQDGGGSVTLSNDPGAAVHHVIQGIVPSRSIGSSTVQKANDVLHEIGKLKREMESVLQEASQAKFDLNGSDKTKDSFYWTKNRDYHPSSVPSLLQTAKAPKSMFEDAEKILREIKKDKRVLEDNLEAILQAKDGSAVYSAISALSTDGNAMEDIRIKSTVDAWIKEISTEIQEEMVRKERELVKYNQNNQEIVIAKKDQGVKCTKATQERNNRLQTRTVHEPKKPLSGSTVKAFIKQSEDVSPKSSLRTQLQKKEVHFKTSTRRDELAPPTEEHITHLYGKPIYQSHRSTLKKGPYLRFNSPSPKSKPQRPKVVEFVRGVKVKTARTQTRSSSLRTLIASPKLPLLPFQLLQENQYVFSPSREMPAFSGPQEGHLIPMAIPLGQSQIDVAAPHPASVVVIRPHPVTVTTSVSPSLPKPHLKVQKPNIAVVEMKSEKKDPPKLSVQVLPSVDIDSFASESIDSVVVPPSIPAETPPQTPERAESEENYVAFPGTEFIDVTDIAQEMEEEVPEAALEYNGWSEPEPHKYSGIPFPPTIAAPQPTTDVLDNIIERRETLENRLVSWVEQEVMARMISEMYPVQRETVPNVSVSDNSESELHASDIVDTVGGEGFQLFVDAGVPVDSDLLRQLVNEAVAETVAVMLGEREERKVETVPVKVLVDTSTRTPLATPQCTPPPTPSPPKIEQLAIKTPVMSPQTSGSEDEDGKQKTPTKTAQSQLVNQSLVGTPAVTPVSTPPRVATPTPPLSEQAIDTIDMPSPTHPSPWGDVELPLEEENPSSVKDEAPQPEPIVMSVAKEEEPESLISAPSPDVEQPSASLPPDVRSPVPVRSPSSSPTTEESSLTLTITETDTPDRPISEGELLFSYGQLVAAKALAEGGLMFTNANASLSSTLRDAHEMEDDPPSEGQVIQRPHQGHHRDPVLSLLVKLNQAPITSDEPVYDHENSDEEDSVGELSEGQRPRLTIAAESVLLGSSVHMNRPALSNQTTAPQSRSLRSPGQCDEPSGVGLGESDASLGPLSLGELGTDTGTSQQPTQSNRIYPAPTAVKDKHKEKAPQILHVEAKAAPARIIQVGAKAEATRQEGSRRDLDRTHIEPSEYLTSFLAGSAETRSDLQTTLGKRTLALPSMIEDHLDSIRSLQDDTDSSGADTF